MPKSPPEPSGSERSEQSPAKQSLWETAQEIFGLEPDSLTDESSTSTSPGDPPSSESGLAFAMIGPRNSAELPKPMEKADTLTEEQIRAKAQEGYPLPPDRADFSSDEDFLEADLSWKKRVAPVIRTRASAFRHKYGQK